MRRWTDFLDLPQHRDHMNISSHRTREPLQRELLCEAPAYYNCRRAIAGSFSCEVSAAATCTACMHTLAWPKGRHPVVWTEMQSQFIDSNPRVLIHDARNDGHFSETTLEGPRRIGLASLSLAHNSLTVQGNYCATSALKPGKGCGILCHETLW